MSTEAMQKAIDQYNDAIDRFVNAAKACDECQAKYQAAAHLRDLAENDLIKIHETLMNGE
ncbi:MAG: hypothetical protein GTN99_02790 [Candidatus Dadabacteria bacterium]|nr:hypothetical protein [Candidatus Dadabacteria bacterium]